MNVKIKALKIKGMDMAYREVGNPNDPTIVLLHGMPASSNQYRKALNQLSDEFHLIAPDFPGYGNSGVPPIEEYKYTYDNIAQTINEFLEKKGINSYTLMVQDIGAPIGFRIATAHPDRIKGLIIQNGNIYEEGLSEGWAPMKAYWKDRSKANEENVLHAFSQDGVKMFYTYGAKDETNFDPDIWTLDYFRISRPEAKASNLELVYDYQNNVKLYPKWQQYLRDKQPSVLIVWGKNDGFFTLKGAEAYKRDVKNIDFNLYDTGHFPMEEYGQEINEKIRGFMQTLN